MTIQFNTDHNIAGTEAFRDPLIALISEELSRFSPHITRLEVHLTDQDGNKNGPNDNRCIIEARIEGMHPIAVSSDADTRKQAVEAAIAALKRTLESLLVPKNTR